MGIRPDTVKVGGEVKDQQRRRGSEKAWRLWEAKHIEADMDRGGRVCGAGGAVGLPPSAWKYAGGHCWSTGSAVGKNFWTLLRGKARAVGAH